jgi:O-antigen/teichoic acid export membrane protein
MPTGAVAIPALSRIQNDPERFRRYYLRAVNLIMWISAPLFGCLFVAAKPVIDIVLGNKWHDAVPVFQLLCISALVHPLLQSTNWALISSGRSKRLFRIALATSVVTIATFAFALPLGIRGIAMWYSVAAVVTLPCILKFAFWRTDLTLKSIGRAILWPILLCLGGVLSAEVALRLFAPAGDLSQLFLISLVFAAACSAALLLPSVRREVRAQRLLLSELRVSRQVTEPAINRKSHAFFMSTAISMNRQ